MVYVVDNFTSFGIHNYPVHTDIAGKAIVKAGADGIKSAAVVVGIPFITDEFAKIAEVNDGKLILREFDSHKGIAELFSAIEKQRGKQYAHKKNGNWNVEGNFGHKNLRLKSDPRSFFKTKRGDVKIKS